MEQLLSTLHKLSISLELREGNLDLYDPKEQLTKELLDAIRSNKSGLIELLKGVQAEQEDFEHIPIAPTQDIYPLSSAQERMYFLYIFDEQSTAYNIPDIRKFDLDVDKVKLENAFRQLIARHDILRTTFHLVDDRPVQKVTTAIDFKISFYQKDAADLLNTYNEFVQAFKLDKESLLRVALVQTTDLKYYMMLDMHHIITDGLSYEILFAEFLQLYRGKELPPVRLQYKDYVAWQNSAAQQEKLKQQKDFWFKEFAKEINTLNLPTDHSRPAEKSYQGAAFNFELDTRSTSQLKKIAEQSGATMYMMLFAIYHILLSKLSTQRDIVIGTPIAGRYHNDLQQIIGLLMNTLPIRIQAKQDQSFQDFLAVVKTKIIACFENQIFQYEDLVDQLQITRDTSRNPLFEAMFQFENYTDAPRANNVTAEEADQFSTNVSKFDLTLNAVEIEGKINLSFIYSTALFDKPSIRQFANYFQNIVQEITSKPDSDIATIKILSAAEEQQLLKEFNDTQTIHDKEQTVLSLFETQVRHKPDTTAIRFNDKVLSYKELDQLSNQLANYLIKEHQIITDDLVGIMLERTEWMIIAIMGIIKAGSAYVPIDPNYPVNRKEYIQNDANCKLIIDNGFLNKFKDTVNDLNSDKPLTVVKASHLIYVIYTSGSSGNPKGVMLEHRNVVSFFNNIDAQLDYAQANRIAATTNITFDISVLEILGTLCLGKEIILFGEEEANPDIFLQKLVNEQVEMLQLTPSRLLQIADLFLATKLSSLKTMVVGGETFPSDIYQNLAEYKDIQIINVYGPTEATIWSSSLNLHSSKNLSIGTPLQNEQIYILDDTTNLVPIGVTGEICIAGEGISRGYHNKTKLTALKFLTNPFRKGERMYKTGDLGKWLPDGKIAFIGRKDKQVKIRGHRIELGEIDLAISNYKTSIIQVSTLVKGIDQNKVLVSYYVASETMDKEQLKSYLQEKLPAYMIPSHFVSLEKMPLNSSGKINHKAFPDITGADIIRKEYISPRNKIEQEILEIWEEVLGIQQISMLDNFFDIGGNSLLIVKLFSKLKSKFSDSIRMAELFSHPNIEAQAKMFHLSTAQPIEINEIDF